MLLVPLEVQARHTRRQVRRNAIVQRALRHVHPVVLPVQMLHKAIVQLAEHQLADLGGKLLPGGLLQHRLPKVPGGSERQTQKGNAKQQSSKKKKD